MSTVSHYGARLCGVLTMVGMLAAALTAHAAPSGETSSKLTLVAKDAFVKQVGYYMPQRLTLSATRPAGIKKEPKYENTPMYGVLHFGDAKVNDVFVVLDEKADASTATLYVDSNHDGDLTNDAPITWKRTEAQNQILFSGSVEVKPRMANRSGETPLALSMYRFAPATAKARNLPTDMILYYRNYARAGELTLGGKKYPILLVDNSSTGHFDLPAPGEAEPRQLALLIDRDGDGKFDFRYERYDLTKPFNIAGKTYEVVRTAVDGSSITVKPSSKEVAELVIPPLLKIGQPAKPFNSTLIDGKPVSFPGDFKGKIVMLDFWATWCGPCRAELPGLVAAYQKYHDKGFEVLGVSLDQEKQLGKVQEFLKANKMDWPEIYDGKFWKAEIAVLYGIDSIPHPILVDGDTGKVLANGEALRGDALDASISKALEGRHVSF